MVLNIIHFGIRELFYINNNTLEQIDKKLAQYGVKFLIIDKLEKTPIDGYAFWSNDNPTIALSLRHNRIDNFALTIFHEIGHIALHLKDNKAKKLIDLIKNENNIYETQANKYAQENLIPNNYWNELSKYSLPLNDSIIYKFSEKYRINPAIILGRMCFEMKNYKIKTNINKKLY